VRLDCSEERQELLYGAEDVLIALANGDARAGRCLFSCRCRVCCAHSHVCAAGDAPMRFAGPYQQRVMAKLAFVKVGAHPSACTPL
jgi:hypothetical protein